MPTAPPLNRIRAGDYFVVDRRFQSGVDAPPFGSSLSELTPERSSSVSSFNRRGPLARNLLQYTLTEGADTRLSVLVSPMGAILCCENERQVYCPCADVLLSNHFRVRLSFFAYSHRAAPLAYLAHPLAGANNLDQTRNVMVNVRDFQWSAQPSHRSRRRLFRGDCFRGPVAICAELRVPRP